MSTQASIRDSILELLDRCGGTLLANQIALSLNASGVSPLAAIKTAILDMVDDGTLRWTDDMRLMRTARAHRRRFSEAWENFRYPDLLPLAREQACDYFVLSADDAEWLEKELASEWSQG